MTRKGAGQDDAHGGGGHGTHGDGHPPSSVGPKATRVILTIFFVLCGVVVIADFLYHRHLEHPLEGIKAFYPLYGLIGVSALILAAKGLRRIVMRSEDYYDAD